MIELILKENVHSLGQMGDLVKVKDGYARNFLLPRKLGVEATATNRKLLEKQQGAIAAKKAQLKQEAETLKTKLESLQLCLNKESGEEDKLFGAVTTRELSELLRKDGFTIEKSHIRLSGPIKVLGTHSFTVKLHPEVVATLNLVVAKHA